MLFDWEYFFFLFVDLLKVSELNKEIDDVCVYIEKSQSSIGSVLENNPFVNSQHISFFFNLST